MGMSPACLSTSSCMLQRLNPRWVQLEGFLLTQTPANKMEAQPQAWHAENTEILILSPQLIRRVTVQCLERQARNPRGPSTYPAPWSSCKILREVGNNPCPQIRALAQKFCLKRTTAIEQNVPEMSPNELTFLEQSMRKFKPHSAFQQWWLGC